MEPTLLRVAAFATLMMFPAGSRAQEINYQTFLVGQRALGMGGAFTGLADDASATFYNPAGLAQLQSSSLAGSLSVDAYNRYVVDDGYGSPVGIADLEHDATPSLPLLVSIVKKFGPRDEDRVRRHAVALSTINPFRVRRGYEVALRNPSTGVTSTLRVSSEDRMTWWGPSYAYRITPRLAAGVSAFLSTRELRHEEGEIIITEGDRQPDGVFRNSTLSVRDSVVEVDARQFVFRLGALWDPNDHWRIGVMFQPPGLQVTGSSRIYEQRSFADLITVPATATFFRSDQGDLDAESPIPWELRVGASYQHDEAFTAALDVSLYGPVGSANDPVRFLGQPDPEPMTGDVPQPGLFVPYQYHQVVTANVSVGVESVIAGVVPLSAGLFTNFSGAPPVDEPTYQYSPARVNGYGASLSVGIRSGGYDLAIGAAGLIGRGRGLRLNPNPGVDPNPETYLPTNVESTTVYFFISGARQAVSRLARNAYDEYLSPGDPRIPQ